MPTYPTYDAPYLDDGEHSILDHTGIPGVGGGGGVSYRSDGLVAQQAGLSVDANSGLDDLTWIAAISDSDGNITFSAPDFTVVNSGLYSVSLYGNWSVDDSIETQDRIVSFTPVNYEDPSATSGYAWAAGRFTQNLIIPSSQNDSAHYFNLDFVTYFLADDVFKIQIANNDGAESTELEVITLSIIRIG